MRNEHYNTGYEAAKTTLIIFSQSGDEAIIKFFQSLLNKRNELDPNDFETAKEYDDLMEWYDGQLDYTEGYISENIG